MLSLFNSQSKDFVCKLRRLDLYGFENKLIDIFEFVFWVLVFMISLMLLANDRYQYMGVLVLLLIIDMILSRNRSFKVITLNDLNKKKIYVDGFVREDVLKIVLNTYYTSIGSKKDFRLLLFKNLLNSNILQSLVKMDIDTKELFLVINEELKKKVLNDRNELKLYIRKLLINSFNECINLRNNQIDKSALVLALVNDNMGGILNVILNRFDITYGDLNNSLILISMPVPNFDQMIAGVGDFFRLRMKYGYKFRMNRSFTARPTDYLDQVGIDITSLAQRMQVGFMIGHDREFDQMMNILTRTGLNNVLLIGDSGSGRDTMVMYLAMKIVYDEVPSWLFDKRIVVLNVGELTQGAANVGELQTRLSKIAKEIIEAGNVILYIPNIYGLKQTNIENTGINAADFLKQVFQSSLVPVIGSTTSYEYHTILEKDSEFCNMFEKVMVNEITEDEAIRFLSFQALALEKKNKVVITYKAIKRAVDLSHKYIKDKLLPSSASDLLCETISYVKACRRNIVLEDDVILIAENKTRIPISKVTKNEASNLLNLEEIIHTRLIDQEEAVTSVSNALREFRAGLSKSNGPIATFLFVGPTGVGKTELSKALAAIYFGAEDKMIRFDMSEYQDELSINRFIGSSDGKMSGILTEAVKNNPFSLILLDEFEKANPKILNLFLAVFDEGRLTDSLGRLVDFKNTIIICTSNALSDYIKEELDKKTNYDILSMNLKNKLTNVFRPELLNRFSKILVFKPLLKEHILQITKLKIEKIIKTLMNEQNISLIVTDNAINMLCELGYDAVFGARPLDGVISDNIKSKLSTAILKNEISKGGTVTMDYNNGFQLILK